MLMADAITSTENIRHIYNFRKTVGHGHFGTVKIANLIASPKMKYAIKQVEKSKLKKDAYLIKRELMILKQLDHPNIIRFYETYEDDKYYYFVMEYCGGGELLERLSTSGHLHEDEVAAIMQKAFSALKHLHKIGIAHRDLKPENFLFSSKEPDAELKLIDFGLSKLFAHVPGHKLDSVVGTPLYVAPEVLKQDYDERCDNWSLGVMMYFLLSGHLPFDAAHTKDIFDKIKLGKFTFKGKEWKSVSKLAKDLIKQLLVVSPDHRLTSSEALKHPWFEKVLVGKKKKINPQVADKLKNFRAQKKFKKEVMKFMVNYLTEEEISDLRETFRYFDKDNTGYISIGEFQQAMKELGHKLTIKEIEDIMNTIKFEPTTKKRINYSDFIAATMDKKLYLSNERLWDAFKHFDVDNTGEITPSDVKEAMTRGGRKIQEEEIVRMMKEIEIPTGKLSFNEFVQMMKVDDEASSPLKLRDPTRLMDPNLKIKLSSPLSEPTEGSVTDKV
jgi:calcium-dependent protein kinase